ncbi:MAG: efflux transporter outer membrane subunit [Pseudohongiellaceae bacterium]
MRPDRHLFTLVTILLLTGCASSPLSEPQTPDLPDSFEQIATLPMQSGESWQAWWTRFDDPALDALVDRALTDNLDIRLQAQRVQEARAQLGLSDANRMPTLQAQADATREQNPQMSFSLGGGEGGGSAITNQYSLAGMLGYEVDLWGRLANQQEAARSLLDETQFSHEAVRLSITTEVVSTYFNLRAAEARYRIMQSNLETREETLELEQFRYDNGATDRFTLRQAESAVAAVRAQLPSLREQVQVLENALAILSGQAPGDILAGMEFNGPALTSISFPDTLPAMLPSDLLQRRPDIRAARAGLRAADANVAVVAASRWPSLNLSGMLGVAHIDFADVISQSFDTWSTSAALAGPLYDFGRTSARVDSAEAQREQAMLRYRQTVLTAFGEVRDALTIYETSLERLNATDNQVEAVRATRELAQIRYDEGLIGFLELLDAERAMLDAELQLAEAQQQRLSAVATLFKALGGGWGDSRGR